jgi:hypothetical protein
MPLYARTQAVTISATVMVLGTPLHSSAFASSGDCRVLPYEYVTHGQREYRINIESFDALLPVLSNPRGWGENAVAMGGETWNHQANSGHFVRGPNTQEETPNCSSPGWSVVQVVDEQNPNRATIAPGCQDPIDPNLYHHFRIRIYTKDGNGEYWDWSIGNISNGQWDLPGILTHEFGHALNLDHSPGFISPTAAVMRGGNFNQGTTRERDLYSWDLKCVYEHADHRELSGYLLLQNANGTLTEQSSFTGNWNISKVSVGATWHTGSFDHAAAFRRRESECMAWTRGFSTSNTNCLNMANVDERTGIGPTEVTWREPAYESSDRVFYAYWEEDPMWGALGKHRARYRRSTNGFSSSWWGHLWFCSNMTGWMQCDGTEHVYTGKQLAFAWDNYNHRTVVIWARQTRNDTEQDRELLVSLAPISNTTIPQPDSLGVQSTTPPAIACNAFSAGGDDCVVAYVPQGDGLNRVRTRRFWFPQGSTRYNINLDPNIHWVAEGARTAAPPALWFNEGTFYLLLRNERPGNPLDLWESSNGASWSFVQTLPETAISLSAPSYVQNAGYVGYAR